MERKRLYKNEVRLSAFYFTIILSIVVLLICMVIFFVIQYYQLLVGDDVLCHYANSLEGYLGRDNIGSYVKKEKTIRSIVYEITYFYTSWGGRLIACLFNPILYIWGQKASAVCGSVVYLFIVILIGRLAWGRWREILLHPFELVFVAIYLYIAGSTGTYMQMWTFVCHYAIPTMLCLVYLIKGERILKQNINSKRQFISTCIIGLFVGLGHELLGAYLIVVIFFQYFIAVFVEKKKISGSQIFIHVGLVVGYAICFFSPGNWVRMTTQHDEARISTDIIKKISTSIDAHYEALIGGNVLLKILLLIIIIQIILGFIFKWNHRYNTIRMLFIIVFFTMASIILWAIVAPPVPQYGMQLWKATIIVCLLKCIPRSRGYIVLSTISVILLISTNYAWCKELVNTTQIRRMQIAEAVEKGEEYVYVKKYGDVTDNYLTWHNLHNYDTLYQGDIIEDFYGIRIIPR